MKRAIILLCIPVLFFPIFADGGPKPLPIESEEAIQILGFSKDGKVAYLRYYDIGSQCGVCPNVEFNIVDLVSDGVIYSKNSDLNPDEIKNASPIGWYYQKNRTTVDSELHQNHIALFSDARLYPPDFMFQGASYRLSVDQEIETVDFQPFEVATTLKVPRVKNYRIVLKKREGGFKVITGNANGTENASSVSVMGAVISPYEPRAAVVVKFGYIDADGAQRNQLRIFGSHLNAGFIPALQPFRKK